MNDKNKIGQSIGEFQNTRYSMAEMATKIQLARSFLDDLIPRHMAGKDIVRNLTGSIPSFLRSIFSMKSSRPFIG